MMMSTSLINKENERAFWACYFEAIANRWKGTLQKTQNGLIAQHKYTL